MTLQTKKHKHAFWNDVIFLSIYFVTVKQNNGWGKSIIFHIKFNVILSKGILKLDAKNIKQNENSIKRVYGRCYSIICSLPTGLVTNGMVVGQEVWNFMQASGTSPLSHQLSEICQQAWSVPLPKYLVVPLIGRSFVLSSPPFHKLVQHICTSAGCSV